MPMKKSPPTENPDAYLATLNGWQGRYAEALRAAVIEAAQGQQTIKWAAWCTFRMDRPF